MMNENICAMDSQLLKKLLIHQKAQVHCLVDFWADFSCFLMHLVNTLYIFNVIDYFVGITGQELIKFGF